MSQAWDIRLTNSNPRRCLPSRMVLQQARLRLRKISLLLKTNPATLEHLFQGIRTMVDRPRSAAASLYPHLPHDDGRVANWAKQRRERNDIADAMWPGPPKPQP